MNLIQNTQGVKNVAAKKKGLDEVVKSKWAAKATVVVTADRNRICHKTLIA